MAATICIGGFCIPVYALIPIAFVVLSNLWEWFKRSVLGQNDDHLFENSRVVHVKSQEQWQELQLKSKTTNRTLVVDFSASWCGPCRYIAPIFHDMSNKYPCAIFAKVDVDEMKPIASACGINAMPTFQFFKNGSKVEEMCGADKVKLETLVKTHYVEVELPEEERPKQPEASNDGDLRQRKPQVVHVKTLEEWRALHHRAEESGKTLIVDFWAGWCHPCAEVAPVFEKLSALYPNAIFAKVDLDEAEEVAEEVKVTVLPTFKVYKSGKCVEARSGAKPSALESLVAKHAA